jgi:hypothetical protein
MGIDSQQRGGFLKRDVEVFSSCCNLKTPVDFLTINCELNLQRHMKEKHPLGHLLDLFDGNFGKLTFVVPGVGDFEFRMMGMVDILVEETVVGLTGFLFDYGPQVLGDDITMAMAFEVGLDDIPVNVRSQLRAKHVENPNMSMGSEYSRLTMAVVSFFRSTMRLRSL